MCPKSITFACEVCGRPSTVKPSDVAHGRGKYCSRACYYASQRKPRMPFEERFWSKVDKTGECWIWTGYRDPNGYGRFRRKKGTPLAHRVAWELTYGPIPEGYDACHRCDNPPCCRPDHLFLGVHDDNMKDMAEKGRSASGDRSGQHTNPERTARGERASKAKLTAFQVQDIRARHAVGGVTQKELAEEYQVTASSIAAILKRKNWRHIE